MNSKIRWGILSTAQIGINNVIPAIQGSKNGVVTAIASRSKSKAVAVAQKFGITKTYSSYEDLLGDPAIDAIYNPLPNNLHLEYTIKALRMGKHVLCEKPIALNVEQTNELILAHSNFPNLKLMEGFMYKFHPQWIFVKKKINDGVIGKIKSIETHFSFYNTDASDIRNQLAMGGGALMDIGCYCISYPRFLLDQEPISVFGTMQKDPVYETDFLSMGTLFFENDVLSNFSCSTQAYPYQQVIVFGENGYIKIDIPCNAPVAENTIVEVTVDGKTSTNKFKANQYQLQCEAFSASILNDAELIYDIKDAKNNMIVLDAIISSSANRVIVDLI